MNVILVPVDFSEVTAPTLRVAADIAARCGAKVYLVHVEELFADELANAEVQKPQRDFLVGLAREHHRDLQDLAKDLEQHGCDVEALLVRGYVVEKLLDEAQRLGADMIIMGSHGHGRLHDLLVGSVCEGVLRKVEVPVLVVPARVAQRDSREASDHHVDTASDDSGTGRRDAATQHSTVPPQSP